MRIQTNALLAAALVANSLAASASQDETRVLAAVRKAYPGTAVERVSRTPMPGVYEVAMGANVAFVSAGNSRYMVFGRLVDLKTMRDLTASKSRPSPPATSGALVRPEEPPAYKGQMPEADAITVVRGAGRRVLSVFTDPSCGYCRQLEIELQQLKDVTIHYYLVPFQGSEAPLAIWCAKDRASAYAAAMAGASLPAMATTRCAHPLDRNRAFAAKLRVQATPTLLFGDGALVPGVMSADELEVRLSAGLDKGINSKGENDGKPANE